MYLMNTCEGFFFDCDETKCRTIDEYKKSFVYFGDKIIVKEVDKEKYLELKKFRDLLDSLSDSFENPLHTCDYKREEKDFFNSLKNEDDKNFYRKSLEKKYEDCSDFYYERDKDLDEENFE